MNDAFSRGMGFGLGLTMADFMFLKVAPPEKVKEVIICQACKGRNPVGKRFCGECGRRIFPQPQVIRPECETAVAARQFCGLCGAQIQKQQKKRGRK